MKRLIAFFLMLSLLTACGVGKEKYADPRTGEGEYSRGGKTESAAISEKNDQSRRDIILAVAVPSAEVDWGGAVSTQMQHMITSYNQQSEQYQITPVTYTDETALQLMVAASEIDMIDWGDNVLIQEDGPHIQDYATKGYLTDLSALLESAEAISLDDFLPNIIALDKKTYGGLYTLPVSFYARTLLGDSRYVPDVHGWTLKDMVETAAQLPDDVVLYAGLTRTEFLELMLDCLVSDYADFSTGTCQFCTEEFYELLNLSREYFPASLSDSASQTESVLSTAAALGIAGEFGENVLSVEQTRGQRAIGYPLASGADGNGANLVFQEELSVCANAANPEGAIDFLTYVFSDEVQENVSLFSPIQSVFENKERQYVKTSDGCTADISESAMEYICNASSIAVRQSPITSIVLEEAAAFFAGDKTAEAVAELIQSRVSIYLAEQS